jgi:hypothetical protein
MRAPNDVVQENTGVLRCCLRNSNEVSAIHRHDYALLTLREGEHHGVRGSLENLVLNTRHTANLTLKGKV